MFLLKAFPSNGHIKESSIGLRISGFWPQQCKYFHTVSFTKNHRYSVARPSADWLKNSKLSNDRCGISN